MVIKISSNKSISEIKQEFSREFPFLRLEFFNKSHKATEASSKNEMIGSDMLIGKIQKHKKEGYLDVEHNMKVQDLESVFHKQFDLFVQVFRSSGKLWLETSGTDGMTLAEQNELGKEKSTPLEKQDLTDIDYD